MTIRKAIDSDSDATWEFFQEVVSEGTTFCPDGKTTREEALKSWMPSQTYVAF